MLKRELWDQIKANAHVPSNATISKLDQLVDAYYALPKTEPLKRYDVVTEIVDTTSEYTMGKEPTDVSVLVATILGVAAADTKEKLQFDVDAAKATEKTGQAAKPLLNQHRREARDPHHTKWGVGANTDKEYRELRRLWKDAMLSSAESGEIVTAFYDWIEGKRSAKSVKFATKYLNDQERISKRLLLVRPGERDNQSGRTLAYRLKKSQGGFVPYDSRNKHCLFVMLEEERFYTRKEERKDGMVKHHSGLAGGKEIFGAGGICVLKGRIVEVSQQSGHYHPSREQVLNVLRALKSADIDLNGITLTAFTYFINPMKPDHTNTGPLPDVKVFDAGYYLSVNGMCATDRDTFDRHLAHQQPALRQARPRAVPVAPPVVIRGSAQGLKGSDYNTDVLPLPTQPPPLIRRGVPPAPQRPVLPVMPQRNGAYSTIPRNPPPAPRNGAYGTIPRNPTQSMGYSEVSISLGYSEEPISMGYSEDRDASWA